MDTPRAHFTRPNPNRIATCAALVVELSLCACSGLNNKSPSSSHPTVAACDNLPAPGTWENITPAGVATTDAIALDPFDRGTLWLGTDPNGGPARGLGGIWKSTDCGATWSHVNTGENGDAIDGAHMWSIALDYVDRGTIYVIGQYGPQGLWKSTNGGVDWVQLMAPGGASNPPLAAIGSISMDPTDHLHLIAGTHGTCNAPYYPLCQIETRDGGANWKIENVNIPKVTNWLEQAGPYVVDADTTIYATLFNGIWLSTDRGTSWKDVTPPEVMGATGGEYTHQPFVRSAKGEYYLPGYGGKNGLLRSSDGRSWSYIANSPNGSYELGFAMGGDRLFMGDFNGKAWQTASEADPTSWTPLPSPAIPAKLQGAAIMDYDEAHHVLYSSNFSGGLWRIVMP
jgi:hypothetical protein